MIRQVLYIETSSIPRFKPNHFLIVEHGECDYPFGARFDYVEESGIAGMLSLGKLEIPNDEGLQRQKFNKLLMKLGYLEDSE